MSAIPVYGVPVEVGTPDHAPYDSAFLRAVRRVTHYKPHLNRCSGGDRTRRYKIEGVRSLTYGDMVALIRMARIEGRKRGHTAEERRALGASLVAALIGAIIADSVEPGESADVEARVADATSAEAGDVRAAQLDACVTSAQMIALVEEAISDDGVVDVDEARDIYRIVHKHERSTRRLVRSVLRNQCAEVRA